MASSVSCEGVACAAAGVLFSLPVGTGDAMSCASGWSNSGLVCSAGLLGLAAATSSMGSSGNGDRATSGRLVGCAFLSSHVSSMGCTGVSLWVVLADQPGRSSATSAVLANFDGSAS